MAAKKYTKEQLLSFYREMFKVRSFDSMAADLFLQARMSGNIHTCVGEEATAVGACQALRPSDFITATHRGHGHCIAKGADPKKMMAELFGKKTGYCKGKGGSMHIADVGLGILGANGIVGAGIPIATGSALASKIKNSDDVTLAFFGDGASNQGTFHESINMASAWKLPIIYMCENNKYGVSVCIDRVTNTEDIADRAQGYHIPGVVVDGNDIFAVYEAVSAAAERARKGDGPTLIECKTYRQRGHYEGDPMVYRTKEEMQAWKEKDPVVRLREQLAGQNGITEEELAAIETEVKEEIEAAVVFAEESPFPEADEVITDMYAVDNERGVLR
jgi:pyruvate dehydrogenase E1 component alpha subunit